MSSTQIAPTHTSPTGTTRLLTSRVRSSRFVRKLTVAVAAALAAPTVLAGCSGVGGSDDGVVTFRFANSPTALSLVRIADELGYWKNAGVKPEYVGPATSVPAVQLLDQNRVDIATGMFSNDIDGKVKGFKFTAIASSMLDLPDQPHMAYFTKAGSPITKTDLKAVEGKTVGLGPGKNSCTDLVIKRYLKKNGVDLDKVKFLELKPELIAPAIERGEVDLGVFHPPLVGVLLSKPDKFTQTFTSYDDWGPLGGQAPFVASNAWLQKHPDAAREFVGIIGKTANWANSHPKESAEIAGKTTGYPVEQTTNWHYAPNALLDKASLALWWDLVKDTGTPLAGSEKLKPEDIATNAFNPYATSADLLDHQDENTSVLPGFRNKGVFKTPLVDFATAEK
ncbi:ABC transporter substrate-binding protein [Gordonia sp. (in: high G+C Gram-positive bacteria)]|jgi:ABC-type nitrate/sulfonate/bicarbonate transport system substrate-binding protein|uniref:ABC transporter substrate-binding protein n=1 Tax=Gordonia sp. (in: high G+C Gram-positive bacteria) TaxID=84139 RepID=UPI0025BD99D5|nr:ABC transporter substrate-binding protein [Gordonia sp. (in: high G+C Gram-positive bacteria)]HMS75190.1 ABC transporter substrate-binding protein [Gordonia sp. (in: high G+C Gram-positive bacteria)]HQV18333.1 ABC transporter substrate-binding protein [Gordonia sp. (in: high G+C Gram-positive bacteria)]